MMPHERRLSVRKMPANLAYLSLPPNNGGIVVDVSEGGLAFRAIAPVQAGGPIHFRFAIDSATRIKAVGELAWIDETGKNGGLRFTQLPEGVREQIRIWAGQVNAGAKEKGKASARVPDVPVAEPAIAAEVAPGRPADLAPVVATLNPLVYNLKPPVYSAPSFGLSMFPQEKDTEEMAAPVVVAPSVGISHPIAAVVLTIVLAFLASVGIFAYVSTSPAGNLLLDWGEKMWGGSYSQPVPGDPAPSPTSGPASSKTHPQ
jgi:hypothetical protein